MKRLKIIIQGDVQGVFYRAFAKRTAEKLNITGYAKNLGTGEVEIMAEGEENNLKEFIKLLKTGPEGAVISSVQIKEIAAEKEYKGFNIVY